MRELSNADYYALRANVEQERADQSDNSLVANIHRELANHYLERSRKSDDPAAVMPAMTIHAS